MELERAPAPAHAGAGAVQASQRSANARQLQPKMNRPGNNRLAASWQVGTPRAVKVLAARKTIRYCRMQALSEAKPEALQGGP